MAICVRQNMGGKIMKWLKNYIYVRQYEYVSTNQHGDRYKKIRNKQIPTATLSCNTNDSQNIEILILLSHTLDIPVRYDFSEGEASIKVMGSEAVEACT